MKLSGSVDCFGLPAVEKEAQEISEAELKKANCPECGPSYFKKTYAFDPDMRLIWQCQNCGHQKEVGKRAPSPKAQQAALDKIRKAIETSGTPDHPTRIVEWTVENDEGGFINLKVWAMQGEDSNMLGLVSKRLLGIRISPVGGVTVYSDSQAKTKSQLKDVERRLRDGTRTHWW
jgi:ribosomal protein L37AE/L43A